MSSSVSREEILEHIRQAMVELFEVDADKVQLQTKVVEDLDLDSIDAIELAVRMETITGRRLDPESFRDMKTIADAVEIVFKLLSSPAPSPEAT